MNCLLADKRSIFFLRRNKLIPFKWLNHAKCRCSLFCFGFVWCREYFSQIHNVLHCSEFTLTVEMPYLSAYCSIQLANEITSITQPGTGQTSIAGVVYLEQHRSGFLPENFGSILKVRIVIKHARYQSWQWKVDPVGILFRKWSDRMSGWSHEFSWLWLSISLFRWWCSSLYILSSLYLSTHLFC